MFDGKPKDRSTWRAAGVATAAACAAGPLREGPLIQTRLSTAAARAIRPDRLRRRLDARLVIALSPILEQTCLVPRGRRPEPPRFSPGRGARPENITGQAESLSYQLLPVPLELESGPVVRLAPLPLGRHRQLRLLQRSGGGQAALQDAVVEARHQGGGGGIVHAPQAGQ